MDKTFRWIWKNRFIFIWKRKKIEMSREIWICFTLIVEKFSDNFTIFQTFWNLSFRFQTRCEHSSCVCVCHSKIYAEMKVFCDLDRFLSIWNFSLFGRKFDENSHRQIIFFCRQRRRNGNKRSFWCFGSHF